MIRYERDGDDLVAVARVRVGTDQIELTVSLGTWEGAMPDADGIRGRPVVVVRDADLLDVARAGVRRSGGLEADVIDIATPIPSSLLRSTAEVSLIARMTADVITAVRALGGRPVPALPLDDEAAAATLLGACPVEVDVPVPTVEPARTQARDVIASIMLPERLRPVDVDPLPAFAELGRDHRAASRAELSAAAGGVLAGRVAASNRRWRAEG